MKAFNFILILSVFALVYFFFNYGTSELIELSYFDKKLSDNKNFSTVLISIAMIIGIFCGEFYRILGRGRSRKIKKADLSGIFAEKSLWKSLLASPLIFGGVYSMAEGQADMFMSLLFAFENGFFCNLILSNKKEEMANNTTPNNA